MIPEVGETQKTEDGYAAIVERNSDSFLDLDAKAIDEFASNTMSPRHKDTNLHTNANDSGDSVGSPDRILFPPGQGNKTSVLSSIRNGVEVRSQP